MDSMQEFFGWTIIKPRVIIREIDLRGVKLNNNLCFCGSGKSYKKCHSDVRDNTTMSYLFEVFKMIDNDIKSAAETPTCKKNCTECCNDYFEVSAPEFFAILMHIQKRRTCLPVSSMRNIQATAQKILSEFPDFSVQSELSGKRTVHPCIFLDNRGNQCKIYEVRPLLCRLYGYYSDFGNCALAKNQLKFATSQIHKGASAFLGHTIIGHEAKAPIAAPLVYWLGGKHPVTSLQDFKTLFLTACEKDINYYMRFSVQLDFDDWFAV